MSATEAGGLDLDAILNRARTAAFRGVLVDEDVPALVAAVRALRAKVERVETVWVEGLHADTCGKELSPSAGYPCSCWKADLRAALDGDGS